MIVNHHYRDAARTAELIFKEVIRDDSYRFRALAANPPATIFDIGANIGMFSLFARVLCPLATIIAVEPCGETFDCLRKNVAHLRVWTLHAAVSAAPLLSLVRDQNSDGSNRFTPGLTGELATGITLAALVAGCEKPYALKLDCEGGERVLVDDPTNLAALAGAGHWALEFHADHAGLAADKFLALLRGADPRATGSQTHPKSRHTDERWLFWSDPRLSAAGSAKAETLNPEPRTI